ncbi:MAG: M48 family metalloprotease [Armatimonadetes bacterium]|nr:M48 family metalloprotease [Armatimonadota bacterium]
MAVTTRAALGSATASKRSRIGLQRSAPPGASATPADQAPRDLYIPGAVEEAPPRRSLARTAGLGLMAALSLAGVVGLTGCSPDPGTVEQPRSSWGTDLSYLLMSTQDEVALGRQVTARIESQVPLWNNPAAQQRLDRLSARLVKDTSRQDITFRFKLLDSDVVNAMAAPGGTIYVTRGLYESFTDDNELMFILGHEMGHIEARHTVKQMGKSLVLEWAARWVAGDRGEAARIASSVAEMVLNNRVSQADEMESDRIGQKHLVSLGINPWHGVRSMERLQSLGGDQQPEIVTEIFGSHPPTRERIEALRQGAQGHPEP